MGFIKVGVVLFASLLVGMANASNGNKNNNNKTENKMTVTELTQEDFVKKVYDFETNPNAWKFEGDKPAVIDFYATWCGPCKMMNERVFTQKVVGDYFKKNFIPLKVDMEKGEGIALRKKFDVNAFPTMFILDAEGNIVGKLQGARDTDIFLKELKEILGDE